MLYTVTYERDGKREVHYNLTHLEANVLASYVRKTFRKEVEITLQEKVVVNA